MSAPSSTLLIIHVLASGNQHRGPAYFFTVGPVLLVMGLLMVASPAVLIRFNSWLAKFGAMRALARARSGTDVSDPNPARIRIGGVVAAVLGAAALAWGITHA